MTQSYTTTRPVAQRDRTRSEERKALDTTRRSARNTKRTLRSIWGA